MHGDYRYVIDSDTLKDCDKLLLHTSTDCEETWNKSHSRNSIDFKVSKQEFISGCSGCQYDYIC